MRTTSDYVWLAILIPLGLWLIVRPTGFQSATYKRANAAKILAWIVLAALLFWIAREIILPGFFDY